MTGTQWCLKGKERIGKAGIHNSLVAALLATMILFPIAVLLLVIGLDVYPNNPQGVQQALEWASRIILVSLGIHWTGMLLALRRHRRHMRPLPITKVGPGILVGTGTMVRFRERCLDLQRSTRKASQNNRGHGEAGMMV